MKKVVLLTVLVLLAILVLGSLDHASAQGPEGGRGRGPRAHILQAVISAVQDETGLDAADIRLHLRDGKTLSEIVTENGGDPQAVIDAAKAELTQEIDQALSNGRITENQAENARHNLGRALDIAMNWSLPERPQPMHDRIQNRVENSLVGTIAELAGVEPSDIIQEWRDGASLAEIVESHGLTVDAVLTEAEARITEEINQAVENGTLTQAQADRLLNALHDRLERRMNISGGRFHRPMDV